MIKLYVEENKSRIEHQGDPIEVAAEMSLACGAIFNALKTRDILAAEFFRAALIKSLDPDSPAWEAHDTATITVVKVKKRRCPHRSKLGHRVS